MKIKQVIFVVVSKANGAHRLVYDADCNLLSGSEAKAGVILYSDDAVQAAVSVRGDQGESIRLGIDGQGNTLYGDREAVTAILHDFLKAMVQRLKTQIIEASIQGVIPNELRDEMFNLLPPDDEMSSEGPSPDSETEKMPSEELPS